MKYVLKSSLKIILFVVAMLVFLPSLAFAADVFDTISSKMITTVKDVRRIAYVIAGFGLVMFTVLAIFNKISFKHLSYIMISLTILALMMPFIEYFSGYKIEDNELNYDNFLQESDAQITGSNANDTEDCIPGSTCPGDDDDDDDDDDTGDGNSGDGNGNGGGNTGNGNGDGTGNGNGNGDGAGAGSNGDGTGAGANGGAGAGAGGNGDGTGADGDKGKERRNPMDKDGDGKVSGKEFQEWSKQAAQDVKDGINAVNNAIDMVEKGKEAYDAAVAGAEAVQKALQGDGNFIDKVAGVSSAIDVAAGNVSGDLSHALGEGESVADYLGWDNTANWFDEKQDKVRDGNDNVEGWTDIGKEAGTIQDRVRATGDRLGKK